MQTLSISKKRFASLEKYQLPSYIINSEANLYVFVKVNIKMSFLDRIFM